MEGELFVQGEEGVRGTIKEGVKERGRGGRG